MIRSTHTYAILPVSYAAYAEIRRKLTDAGYTDQFHDNRDGDGVVIDMHGIALKDEGEKTMQPHQQRVVDEKTELDEKSSKLNAFFNTAVFDKLSSEEQDRMHRQYELMVQYSAVLGERIAAF
jgi:hypothetical protein